MTQFQIMDASDPLAPKPFAPEIGEGLFESPLSRIDTNALSGLIYRYFYNGPIGGASTRLAKILKNHILGLPIMTFKEVLDEFLVQSLALNESSDPAIRADNERRLKAERTLFWMALNGLGVTSRVDDLITYSAAKGLSECIAEAISRRKEKAS